MSLEEKVGQMTQLSLDMFASMRDGEVDPRPDHLDWAKVEQAVRTYHFGSLFNCIRDAFTPRQWRQLHARLAAVTQDASRSKIPILFGIDAVHGANYTRGATLFPHALALGATFDAELVGQVAYVTSKDVAASGIPWNFSPVLDVGRQPLWPRLYETFGEDTYLVSALGAAYVARHSESLTCLKHYVGYSAPLSGEDRTSAVIGERLMRETYLPPFEAAIAAGAPSVMINSASVDRLPGHANAHLLNTILRQELHFDGVAVSDYKDVERLYTRDRVADSPKEAVRMAVMAGVDMSMVPDNFEFPKLLVQLVNEGKVPLWRIDEAVGRILRLKMRAGLLATTKRRRHTGTGTTADKKLNLQAARDVMTLLKNANNTLPLARTSRILVAGPNANDLAALNGGWSFTWQGEEVGQYPHDVDTIFAAVRRRVGNKQAFLARSTAEALTLAKNVDVAVLCLGERPYAETPGNIDDLTLEAAQLELATKIQASGVPVVLVLVEGRPRIVQSVVDGASAVLMAYLPGMAGGTAVAETLMGEHNPAGRLPITYPRATNALYTYDRLPADIGSANTRAPQWPFGHGLSYTTFSTSALHLASTSVPFGQGITVEATVTNTGSVAGKHTALLYLTDLFASVARPARELRGFKKVDLVPGQSAKIRFDLRPQDFSFIGTDNVRTTEAGAFEVHVDGNSATFNVEPASAQKRPAAKE